MKIGFGELIIIFVVALIVIGPDKLPDFARKLGKALREFRDATSEATKDIRENIIEPLHEAQKPLRDAMEPVEEIKQEFDSQVGDVTRSFRQLSTGSAANQLAPKGGEAGALEQAAEPSAQLEPTAEETPETQAALLNEGQGDGTAAAETLGTQVQTECGSEQDVCRGNKPAAVSPRE